MMSDVKRSLRAKVVGLLLLSLTGCANMTDADRTKTEASVTGAGIGAVLGQILGGTKESTAAGAVVGGLIGGAVGSNVAQKKEAYSQNEERLREIIAQAERSTNDAKKLNAKLEEDIKALEQERQNIIVSTENKLNQRRQLKKNHQASVKIIKDSNQYITNLDRQIASLQKQIDVQNQILATQKSEPERGAIIAVGMKMHELRQERAAILGRIERLSLFDKKRVY